MTIPVSILVLTKNEQDDLAACLESVSWSDDIHVLDSYSDDNTVAIAESHGAKMAYRKFDYFSAHQNWALRNIPFRHPWVFYIDADERVTAELVQAVERAVAHPGEQVAFRVQRRDFFLGRWLKHVQASPFYLRLFLAEKMSYERMGHPLSVPDGPVGQIRGYLDHFPFSKGMAHWIIRHDKYSTEEAQQIINNRLGGAHFSSYLAFFGKGFHQKRFHQKELFYRLPGRPLIKFCLLYVLKRGFLDGTPGLTYAILQSIYEYMIVLKTRELERKLLANDGAVGIERPNTLAAK